MWNGLEPWIIFASLCESIVYQSGRVNSNNPESRISPVFSKHKEIRVKLETAFDCKKSWYKLIIDLVTNEV